MIRKILLTILFTLVLSGGASAEKINLSCTEKTTNTVLSFTINTEDKMVSTQGSNYDPYLYSNGVFTFMFKGAKNDFLYRLNRNTGVLQVKAWEKNEEKYEEMVAEIYIKMLADGKSLKDSDYLLNLIVDEFNQKENFTSVSLDCKKSEPKF